MHSFGTRTVQDLTALFTRAQRLADRHNAKPKNADNQAGRDWIATYACERYFGLITCEPYRASVRTLLDAVVPA